jgi:hypothetical protein
MWEFILIEKKNDHSVYSLNQPDRKLTQPLSVKWWKIQFVSKVASEIRMIRSETTAVKQLRPSRKASLNTVKSWAVHCTVWVSSTFNDFQTVHEGKFDAYVLWPFAKRVQNLLVYRFTVRDKESTETDLSWPLIRSQLKSTLIK